MTFECKKLNTSIPETIGPNNYNSSGNAKINNPLILETSGRNTNNRKASASKHNIIAEKFGLRRAGVNEETLRGQCLVDDFA
jgi:hypothetical protein